MAEQDQNPERDRSEGEEPAAEGSVPEATDPESADPVQDPLAQAEEILKDIPAEDPEDIESVGAHGGAESHGAAGDPVTEEEVAGEVLAEDSAEVVEEPELSEVPEGQPVGGETEPEEVVDVAEKILGDEGEQADARVAEADEREAALQADLQRLQAEYVNYRRRVERDRGVERERTVGQVFASLTPVLDDIHAARQAGDLEDGPFAAIASKLETLLEQQGLQRIDEEGVPFDPSVHEALMQQPHPEIPADHVGAVLRAGYLHGDRVLRAAQVMVSTGQAE